MTIAAIIFLMPVNVVQSFVSEDYAEKIILGSDVFLEKIIDRLGYYEDTHQRVATPKENYTQHQKDPRAISDEHLVSDMLLCDSLYITKTHLEKFYGKELNKYEGGLVKTTEGAHNGLHSDMYRLDGSPWNDGTGREDELEYSALLYFSDYEKDFLGGQLVFPQHNLILSPKVGTLVFFRGDLDHAHEVTRIESGQRYAMIMFFGE